MVNYSEVPQSAYRSHVAAQAEGEQAPLNQMIK